MTTIASFVARLKKIGIEVGLVGNYPWIYLDTVNGKRVHGTFEADHGFTCFWSPVRRDQKEHISDIGVVFAKIREMVAPTLIQQMKERKRIARWLPTGDTANCAFCKDEFTKLRVTHVFCSSQCRRKFWDLVMAGDPKRAAQSAARSRNYRQKQKV
jgi:hypothetical protein